MGSTETGRRRRSGSTPRVVRREEPNREKIIFFLVAAAAALAALLWWFLREPPPPAKPVPISHIDAVRSSISELGDSVEMIVVWDLSQLSVLGHADSLRVEVVPEDSGQVLLTQSADQKADTVRLLGPQPGKTAKGYSCVAVYSGGEPGDQACTPWQYVRPAATAEGAAAARVKLIVVQPSGLQVDPDVGGACERWQRAHPDQSVWIVVNRTAVPDCTGPNLKPTVAQFCAFAVLPNGRRVKTATSTNNNYCEELFVEWTRERYS
jgi:hypothetical protein